MGEKRFSPFESSDLATTPLDLAWNCCALLRDIANKIIPAASMIIPKATPAPIPAFAPEDIPLDDVATSVKLESMIPPEPVLIAVGVRVADPVVAVATHRRVESDAVHLAPLLQHPPPSAVGQANWLVRHAVAVPVRGITVAGSMVEVHPPLGPHVDPYEQQPPPRDDGHKKALVASHALEEQLNVAVALPLTVVVC